MRQFYTAPTLLRSLLQMGDQWVTKYNRASLEILGSVGEPINEHAWQWYHTVSRGKRALLGAEMGLCAMCMLPAC